MSDWNSCDSDIGLQPSPITDAGIGELTVDELIEAWEGYHTAEEAARNAKHQIVRRLIELSPPQTDGCRTTRVRGEHRRVKLEWPEDAWDQAQLKEAWHAYPAIRDEYLAIATLRVRLVEYKKLLRENGPPNFEMFKQMLLQANRTLQGQVQRTPRIIVEK